MTSLLVSTRLRGKGAKVYASAPSEPVPCYCRSFCTLCHPYRDSYILCSLRAADSLIAVDKSTPDAKWLPNLKEVGTEIATLRTHRAASSAPLASIDYNINLTGAAPRDCHELPMPAAQPRMLTPAQAALMHALGAVQGYARPTHA